MTAGLEATTAEEFLVSTLTGDATLMAQLPGGVWNIEAPEGTPYPFLVFQFMSGNDFAAVGALRIWTNMIYLVKVIADAADFDSLNAVAARLDAVLHGTSGTVSSGVVWSCTREQTIRLPDQLANRQFRQAGGLYRLYAA